MEFANGFEEEDDPILPPIAAAAPPAAPRFIPKRRNRAVVDLTDSPPPSTTSLPSFETEEGAETLGVPVASGSGTTKRKERIPPLPSSTNGFPQHAAQGTPPRASGSGASGSGSSGFAAYASASPSSTYRSIAPSSNAQAGSSRPIQHAPVASLGSIPIINSASTARLPSAYLTALSKSGAEAHNPRPQAAAGSSKGAMGKGKDAIIDLTTSDAEEDDDEIIVDDTPICIGQLTTVALILYPIPEIQLPSQSSSSSGSFAPPTSVTPPLRVHIWREQPQGHNQTLKLLTTRGKETFGVMEHKVANVLAPLLGEGLVGTGVAGKGEGRGPDGAKVWCVANLIRRGEKNPMMLQLQLLLFVRPYQVQLVSEILSKSTNYLEHPASYNPADFNGYSYSNPHNPAAGVSGRGDAERRRAQLTSGIYGGAGLAGTNRAPKTVEVQKRQVDDVLENLKSGVDLDEMEPPAIVTTSMYPHQKQALSFLLDRERKVPVTTPTAGKEDDLMISLWKRRVDTYNRPIGWTNVVTTLEITGAAPPPQTQGAILADDMGIGKTIVVIALVAHTLEEAKEWAKLPLEREQHDPRFDEGAVGGKDGAGKELSRKDFMGSIPGEDLFEAGGSGKGGSGKKKKKDAAAKREKKREDVTSARFNKLVVKSRATLIICPLSTVQNWENQFEEHVARVDEDGKVYEMPKNHAGIGSDESGEDEDDFKPASKKGKGRAKDTSTPGLSIYVYHGTSRLSDPLLLADFDVVITTFSTLGTEYSKQGRAELEREAAEEAAEAEADSDVEIMSPFDPRGLLSGDKNKALPAQPKPKRKRKRVEGNGESPLQQIQWWRIVLDEAHIIKEHTTIQARAACDLSASRRTALSGTPLQNSLNDLYSLVRFLRLEPFTDRAVWTKHIGALAKNGDDLGVSRLQLIMRHLTLRRTKNSVDKDGVPILDLPPNTQTIVHLTFDPAEHAFYSSHHNRYKHDFKKLEETDSVMKNYCSILQELLRLRQICVHTALVQDSEDVAGGSGDLIKMIEQHGISKPRAIQLLSLMRDAGGAQCCECGTEILAVGDAGEEEEEKKPAKKSRKVVKSASAPASAAASEDESGGIELRSVITRCQHLFCRDCFRTKVCSSWPNKIKSEEKATCTVCKVEMTPALDVVEIGARELEKALDEAAEGVSEVTVGKKKGKKATRIFEHSTKTKALLVDLLPFSQINPASANFIPGVDPEEEVKTQATGGTIGFQPVAGEIVKSVVFSQWTKLLDRLGDALDQEHFKYARLDGAMNREQRTKAMDAFKLDPACEVLLVSLRAGGVGLNLTAGRRVYLMEPFWNPAVENQAVDRCHRLGQTMPVQTVRFIIEKSIEENMLKIQKRKTDLANMSLTQTLTKAALKLRRQEDLKVLMS